MGNIFAFQAHWYNEWDEQDVISQGAVFANDMTDAMFKITRRLPYSSCVMITELDDTDFIFMDEAHYAEFEHDICAFDNDEDNEINTPDDTNW